MDEADTALAAANELAAGRNARLRHLEKLATELSAEIARLDQLEQETGPCENSQTPSRATTT